MGLVLSAFSTTEKKFLADKIVWCSNYLMNLAGLQCVLRFVMSTDGAWSTKD